MGLDFTTFQNWLMETEADVQAIVIQLKLDEAVAEKDINDAFTWVASHAPVIASDIQEVLSIVTQLGLGANPDVAAAVLAANVAVNALNAFAAAKNSGSTNAQSVIAGYVAVTQAKAAVANAKAAAIAAPAKVA